MVRFQHSTPIHTSFEFNQEPMSLKEERSKYLVVTTYPPHKTGIADFSQNIFGGHGSFDLQFCKSNEYSEIIGKANSIVSAIGNYQAILIVLGNSHHNRLAAAVLSRLKGFRSSKRKIFLQIHDPVLTNIISDRQLFSRDSHAYYKRTAEMLGTACPDQELFSPSQNWRLFQDYGITGIEFLSSLCSIHGLIMHSQFAASLYTDILHKRHRYLIPELNVIPHPCFDDPINIPWRHRRYDLGIFGVLDNGGKMTNKSIEVFTRLRERGLASNCAIAGYNANEWKAANSHYDFTGCHFFDNPSRGRLSEIMANCRVALQPRASSTGESSGVVPMLISAHVPTIVSRVGAFTEYPQEVVTPVDNEDFVANTLVAFEQICRHNSARLQSIDHFLCYNKKNSTDSFVTALREILDASTYQCNIRISHDRVAVSLDPLRIKRL